MSTPVEQELVEQHDDNDNRGFWGSLVEKFDETGLALLMEPRRKRAETAPEAIWDNLLKRFEGRFFGKGGRLDSTEFWRDNLLWSIVTHIRDDEDAQRVLIDAGEEAILARLETSDRRPLRDLYHNLYQDLTIGQCAGKLPKGHAELVRQRVASPEEFIEESRERMMNPVYGVRTPHSLVSVFRQEFLDFLQVTASQYKQPTDQHNVLGLARKHFLEREDLLKDKGQRDPLVDEAVYYLYRMALLNLPEAARVEVESICKEEGGAKEYWERLVGDLQHSEYGVDGPYDISRAVLLGHNQVLGYLTKRDSEIQVQVADEGQNQILAAIKDGETTPEQAEKLVAVHKEMMTSLKDSPEIWVEEACKDKEGAEKYWGKLVGRLKDPDYGVGGKYDVSAVLTTTHGQVLTKVAKRDDYIQADFFNEGEKQILQEIEKEDTHPQLGQVLLTTYTKAVETLEAASEVWAERACESLENAKRFWTDYAHRLNSRQYGLDGKVNLGEQFNKRKDAVIAQVAEMDARSQRIFMRGAAEAIVEFLEGDPEVLEDAEGESLANAGYEQGVLEGFDVETRKDKGDDEKRPQIEKALVRISPDVRALLMQDLLELFSDSPVALAMIARDPEGGGARQVATLEAVQRYLVRYIIGLSLEGEGRHEGLGLEAGDGHQGIISDLGNFISSRFEKKTAAQKALCHVALTAIRENLLQAPKDQSFSDQECRDFEKGFTAAIEHATRLLKEGNFDVLQSLEAVFKNLSPWSYATWLCANPVLKPSFDQAMRYDDERDRLVKEALQAAAGQSQAKQFYAVVEAAAKLDPTLVYLLPEDSFIQEIQAHMYEDEEYRKKVELGSDASEDAETQVETRTVNQARTHLVMANKLTGFGDVEQGFRPILFGKMSEGMVSERRLTAVYVNQLIARIQDPDFNNGSERLQSIIAGDLMKVGLMLRDVPREDEEEGDNELKAEARERFIPLLLDILTRKGEVESMGGVVSFDFCEPVRQMAERVLGWCMPYWPEEDQKRFIDVFINRVNTGEWGLIEEGGFNRIAYPLAIWQDPLPEVEGQQGEIRPIAGYLAEKAFDLLLSYPYLAGRSDIRSVIETVVDRDDAGSAEGNFIGEVINLIAWIAPDRIEKLEQILSELGAHDTQRFVLTKRRPDANVRQAIAQAERFQLQTGQALMRTLKYYDDLVATVAGFSEPFFGRGADGNIIETADMPALTAKLTEEVKGERGELEERTGLKEVDAEALKLVTDVISQVSTADPMEIAEKILATVEEHRHDIPVKEMLKALKIVLGHVEDGEKGMLDSIPRTMVWLTPGGMSVVGALLTLLQRREVGAEAIQEIIGNLLEDERAQRSLVTGIAQEVGVMETSRDFQLARRTALAGVFKSLLDRDQRQEAIREFRLRVEELQTQRLTDIAELEADFQTFQVDAAEDLQEAQISRMQLEIEAERTRIGVRVKAAYEILDQMETVLPDLAQTLAKNAATTFQLMFDHATAIQEWMNDWAQGEDSPLARINKYEMALAEMDLRVIVETPDLNEILGLSGLDEVLALPPHEEKALSEG